MRSLLARLAVLGAFAVSMSACSGGNGDALPFAGGPNNAAAAPAPSKAAPTGQTLIRFIQGSPDSGIRRIGTVDVCIDNLPLTIRPTRVR